MMVAVMVDVIAVIAVVEVYLVIQYYINHLGHIS